ncbi:RHS repeat-associated core domain-containing protein [Tengunoibacter tsumagoiensis]|uniref:Hint domain-containing protein n=1 Tax=Tengunoibacter tsumagoiensis TaxID=2014871 RepID=A0A402A3G2_9CHLR|nr:RHS repeat-associated core domain-containing protein [Tengunoibacter tsumagoiensis]GCE13576.1 hypothetical protein KTT_34350 [Tengunoibacter tsumagoiensis]
MRRSARVWKKLRSAGLAFFLVLLVFFGPESPLVFGAGQAPATQNQVSSTQAKKPNIYDPTAGSKSHVQTYKPAPKGTEKTGAPQIIQHAAPMPMSAGSVELTAGQAAQFLGDDGRLEVDIPAGAITADDVAKAGGKLFLQVSQIAPASGSNAGGSGHLSLGTYLFQVVDAKGVLLNHGLRKALTTKYHYKKEEALLNFDHAYVVQNGTHPSKGMKTAATANNVSTESTFGALSTQSIKVDAAQKTLLATPSISTPSSSMSWQSDVSIGTFGKPDPFNVDLNAGSLTAGLSIDVPAGPGGLTPPVNLNYSSESVNGQHNLTGAAGWVGEGWDLSLGSITWSEHNVYAGCNTTACGGGVNWENVWQLSDPFGTSSELIPPNLNVSTFYDDTSGQYCAAGGPNSYPCPIQWHTATESHAKIYAYVGPVDIGMPVHPPCFRVWLANGIMEEFGCTPDSLQHYYQASVGAHVVSGWLLDMITDPKGNQIHLTYQQDNSTIMDQGLSHQVVRDAVLSTIEYDSPNCHDAQTMCTGSNWNPLVRVSFQASHTPARPTNGFFSGCNTGTNLRCDDPFDLSGSGGVAAPAVESTFVLNAIDVQIRPSSSSGWNTLREYQLSYEQSAPFTMTDPSSGKQESVAGTLDLTREQEVGTTGSNAILYSGSDNNSTRSFAYMKAFDLSSQNIVVGPNTNLSYWIFPQSGNTTTLPGGSNSTCVAVDMVFTDNSTLRDSGAVDQNGNRVHPAYQCGHLVMDQWNLVSSNIGSVLNGKTINRILIGYDQPANTGGYRGFIDDIALTNPNSATPLFSTTLEGSDPQLTWNNSVDVTNIANVGGVCCGLSGPELFVTHEFTHADSATLPVRTFSYGSFDTAYVDGGFHPNPSNNCGPSWNTGNGSGCILWSKNGPPNDRYMTSASNGMGMSQSFSWGQAHNNTHGVPGGGQNNADPFYCNSQPSGSYPCNETDDQSWSREVLTQNSDTTVRLTQNGQGGAQTSTPVTSTTSYQYKLPYPLVSQQCSDCVAGAYWGNQNDTDYLSYYNNKFMGYAQTTVFLPDGAREVHNFYSTEGVGIYDTNEVVCYSGSPCHASPWWHLANAAHGHEYEAFYYDTDGSTLLKHTTNTYQAICPPSGVAATPTQTSQGRTYTWDGQLVSELDHNNPVAVCDIQQTQGTSETRDGTGNSVTTTNASVYDSYGRVTQATTTTNGGTPTQTINKTSYIWNDAVTATQNSANGTYILDTPSFSSTEDSSGNRYTCSYTSYDGGSYATGAQSSLTAGLATISDAYSNCGTSANGYSVTGQVRTTKSYDQYGNDISSDDPDANAGIAGHQGCTINGGQHSDCSYYDSTYATLMTSSGNALNQTASTSYSSSALGGFGIWPMSTKDFNNQVSTYSYDAMGRMTGQTLPGETSNGATKSWTFTTWCSGTAAQAPCVEVDQLDRLDNNTTVVSRAFYDGQGRLVETRDPGPNGQDVVAYAYHDAAGHMVFESNSYFVSSYSGPAGPAAFSPPDSTKVGTSTTYDGLERTKNVSDPNSQSTQTSYTVQCGGITGFASDNGCYEKTTILDANNHQRATYTDGFGRVSYDQRFTGNSSGNYALYVTTAYTHDYKGNLTSIIHPGNTATTSSTFDGLGRKTSMSDPDRGNETYSYDPSGNQIQTVDARGSSGTVYAGYDGLNRLLWRNTTNSSTGAEVSYSYDSTANGNYGVGRKTSESFTGPNGLTGSYSYTYDQRGQQIGMTTTVNGNSYSVQKSYNDAGHPISQTYPTGEVVQTNMSAQGWLNQVTTTLGGTTTTLAGAISYTGPGGAASNITGMLLGNGIYTYAASYDPVRRLASASITRSSDSTLLYKTQPTYDAVSNVTTVATTLTAGTDNQQFCYDEQNRLTWAGASGTPPCGSLTAGSLTGAQYQQSFGYDSNGRLTAGPQGSYTYGSTPLHGVTSTSSGYSAAYDAAGNMTCRATTSATTCSGTQTGQQLSYDAEGRLSTWQNQPTPTSTVSYLYDGEGTRVAQQVGNGGGTPTTTVYVGDVEEVVTGASPTTTTTFYFAGSQRIAEAINGVFSYFASDRLGSPVVTLSAGGAPIATQLYAPYGASRYTNGTMPSDIGFTGQKADSATGLDYYVSRYYDPSLGQFISPDSELPQSGYNPWGLSRYAYVQGNPETATDPDGHCWPVCTMIAGAIIGAAMGAGVSIATQAASGHGINWHDVGREAAVGAVSGAVSGLAGPEAGLAVHAAVGAASGAAGQLISNAIDHKPLGDGVLEATVVGGMTGVATAGAGKLLQKYAGKVAKSALPEVCGLSFAAETPVATPDGEQRIDTLKPGDKVTAYDPATKQPSTQKVQQVFLNHDNDLIDVTLSATDQAPNAKETEPNTKQQDAEVKSHGSLAPPSAAAETVHTTQKHPWFTARGWVNAGDLKVGDQVQQLDGRTATITELHTVAGEQDMYDLSVSTIHTFAVGELQLVVHNCNEIPFGKTGREFFGGVKFRGINRNRALGELTDSKLSGAFKGVFKKMNIKTNSHVFEELRREEASGFGMRTLRDVERVLNKGHIVGDPRGEVDFLIHYTVSDTKHINVGFQGGRMRFFTMARGRFY